MSNAGVETQKIIYLMIILILPEYCSKRWIANLLKIPICSSHKCDMLAN